MCKFPAPLARPVHSCAEGAGNSVHSTSKIQDSKSCIIIHRAPPPFTTGERRSITFLTPAPHYPLNPSGLKSRAPITRTVRLTTTLRNSQSLQSDYYPLRRSTLTHTPANPRFNPGFAGAVYSQYLSPIHPPPPGLFSAPNLPESGRSGPFIALLLPQWVFIPM